MVTLTTSSFLFLLLHLHLVLLYSFSTIVLVLRLQRRWDWPITFTRQKVGYAAPSTFALTHYNTHVCVVVIIIWYKYISVCFVINNELHVLGIDIRNTLSMHSVIIYTIDWIYSECVLSRPCHEWVSHLSFWSKYFTSIIDSRKSREVS